MDELFNILSSSARFNKKKKPKKAASPPTEQLPSPQLAPTTDDDVVDKSRDRTGKRDDSDTKRDQIHKEEIAAFRSSMGIKLANKHDPHLPDPLSKFQELRVPSWWAPDKDHSFQQMHKIVQANIERGRWKEPTPIQMQALPSLMERRDFIGAAYTGSGKSGAFLIPTIFLTSVSAEIFYKNVTLKSKADKKAKSAGKQGEIRSLILAPSSELAAQLYREYERLSLNLPGGRSSLLLSKSNAANVIAGTVGGKKGLDVLVATPLRLVDSIQKGLRLDAVRMVVLDECDRLLDAADGKKANQARKHKHENDSDVFDNEESNQVAVSGSSHTQTFLAQMDTILAEIPPTAVRALFSATVTPTVRSLAESILRNPVDVTIRTNTAPGGANPDINQKLLFVGREEGKLLAIRQIVQRGELRPPVIIFLQSKERAQALFSELLYDGIHVDVIHAGRSKSARDNAVAKFRRGDTWVLITTDLMSRGVDFKAVNMVINYDIPDSGITYCHRIGRCGRNKRQGEAITFFTESDFPNMRTIANIMKQSGCPVEDWMLKLPSNRRATSAKRDRKSIDTTPRYDKEKQRRKRQMVQDSRRRSDQADDS